MGVLSTLASAFNVGGGVAGVVDSATKFFDEVTTSDEEREQLRLAEQKIAQNPAKWTMLLNTVEARHRSVFVAGWRPYIGWVAGTCIALFYIPQFVMGTFLWCKICLASGTLVQYPIQAAHLFELVGLMLGFGGLRTWEKKAGVTK